MGQIAPLQAAWDAAQREADARRDAANASADPQDHWAPQYEWWERMAAGLVAVLRAAGQEVPVESYTADRPREERERRWALNWTHGWLVWVDTRGQAGLDDLLRHLRQACEDALRAHLRARQMHGGPYGRDYEMDAGDSALRRLGDGVRALQESDDSPGLAQGVAAVFDGEYRVAFPGKRRGTRHYHNLLAEKTPLALRLIRRQWLADLEREAASCEAELAKEGQYPGLRANCRKRRAQGEWLLRLGGWITAFSIDAPLGERAIKEQERGGVLGSLAEALREAGEADVGRADGALARADEALGEAREAARLWRERLGP